MIDTIQVLSGRGRILEMLAQINRHKANIIDLFAGAGGLSLGAERAGFCVSCAVEVDKHALSTHSLNFPSTMHLPCDIASLTGFDILNNTGMSEGQIDGIIGGPPCQGFSTIGQQSPSDSRSQLFISFFRLVGELKPKFFLAENVPGILHEQHKSIRDQAFSLLAGEYEALPPFIVRANEYGAATSRTRIFFLGYHKKKFTGSFSSGDFSPVIKSPEKMVRVKKALTGLPIHLPASTTCHLSERIPVIDDTDLFSTRIHGFIPNGVGDPTTIEAYAARHLVSGCLPTRHSVEVIKRFEKLEYGKSDPISKSPKLDPDGFCPTLRAGTGPDKGSFQAVRPIHYAAPRVITPREAARLQGFPDWFAFPTTKWHSFRQIGNSVSPIVAEELLSVIYQKMT